MNQEDFESYIGKPIQVGVPRYGEKDSIFMHSGILKKVTEDGILIQKDRNDVFLKYGIIQYYCPSGLRGNGEGRFTRD